jgi:hypothetical protein
LALILAELQLVDLYFSGQAGTGPFGLTGGVGLEVFSSRSPILQLSALADLRGW